MLEEDEKRVDTIQDRLNQLYMTTQIGINDKLKRMDIIHNPIIDQ